jgi:signal transduction histidine kinase
LEFHYTALSFSGPEKSRFKYKLQNVDPDWIDAESRRVAYYSHVPPGKYQFRVIACNDEGVWNETGASIDFVLEPHAWQSWWFKVAGAVLVITGLGAIYSFRTVRSRHIEKLRMRIAADLHDEIGSSIGSISLLARKIHKTAPLTEEQSKDLGSIHRIAGQTANSIRDIVWFINPEYDTVQDLVLRMKDVAGTMLSTIPFQFVGPKENLTKKLPLDFRREIFLIFKEALANVIKHSRATSVCIQFSEDDGVWQLRIVDNGVGFDAGASYSGNGLKNLRRRAEKIDGTLLITSQPGTGAELVVRKRKL